MRDGLYHTNLGLPVKADKLKIGEIKLEYSIHAKQAALNDKYGQIKLPEVLNTNKSECIEVEILCGRINKLVFRTNYTNCLDLIIVLGSSGTVKTVWLNLKTDTHKTLDRTKYQRVA